MRTLILGVIISLFVLLAGGLAIALLGFLPTTADAEPPLLEVRIATSALDASVDRHASRLTSPAPLVDDSLIQGMKIYTMNCAMCHGTLDMKPSPLQNSFYPPAPQLVLRPEDGPDWRVYYFVRTGVRYTAMPAWNKTLTDQEMWDVTAFLTRLQKLPPAVQDYWKASFGIEKLPTLVNPHS